VIIIGAGPAGSALAIHLLEHGRQPLIIEKDTFPRHHIGESLTGECRELLAELGLGTYMTSAGFPVKRGVSVSGESDESRFWVPVESLSADGSRIPATTWQVRRDEFDAKLLETAIERGAGFLRARCVGVNMEDGRVSGVELAGGVEVPKFLKARAVADCSGQQSLFAKLKLTSPKLRTGYENQVAFYAQLSRVDRDAAPNDGSTHIFYGKRHHWAWAIPLSDTITSVGVVLPKQSLGNEQRSVEEIFNAGLHNVNPELIARTQNAEIVSDIYSTTNYSYHIDEYTGPGYLCVGDSHKFLDPIFSFGVLISLQEAKLAAKALDDYLNDPASAGANPFGDYVHRVDRAQRVVEYIIRTFWDFPLAFLKLAHFTHNSDIAEIFSGRLYSDAVDEIAAVGLMKDLLSKTQKGAS
jgi:flavin-dependent dehydrogenase